MEAEEDLKVHEGVSGVSEEASEVPEEVQQVLQKSPEVFQTWRSVKTSTAPLKDPDVFDDVLEFSKVLLVLWQVPGVGMKLKRM